MGTYRAPDIIKNSQGLLERNKATDDFNKGLNAEFDKQRKSRIANAKINTKNKQALQKRKLKDADILNKELEDSGLLSGANSSSTREVIKQIREEYYKCAGIMTTECSENRAYWRSLPEQIAKGVSVQMALSGEYNKIMKINENDPDSMDYDSLNSNNFKFGREFDENDGANVICKYDPKTKKIYWEIADTKYTEKEMRDMTPEERTKIMGGKEVYMGGDYTMVGSGARMDNDFLIKSQVDPNNKVPFFPTNGDPKAVTNIMHNGVPKDGIDGLGVGLKDLEDGKKELTVTRNGKEVVLTDPKDINDELRKRLAGYDFSGTLNTRGASKLWGGALRSNLSRIDSLKGKDDDYIFTDTEIRLAKTWYGDDWKSEINNPEEVDDDDPIKVYQEDVDNGGTGTAAFGEWISSDPEMAKSNSNMAWQRNVVSNGLIIDYEEEYLLEEPVKDDSDPNVDPWDQIDEDEGDPRNVPMASTTDEDKINVQKKFDSLKPGESMSIVTANGKVINVPKPKFEVEEEVEMIIYDQKQHEQTIKDANATTKSETKSVNTQKVEEVVEEPKDEVKVKEKEAERSGYHHYTGLSSGETKVIDQTKLKNASLKTDKKDGKDYIRRILNFENSMGSFSGGSVGNYGFSGTKEKGKALLKLFKKAEGTTEEKALATIDKYIIGEGPNDADVGGVKGNTTILKDLGMTRANFDALSDDIKRELVDWKFNSGRGTTDLVMIAGGGNWDADRAFFKDSPSSIGDIDISTLTVEKLRDARQQLYKGRIEGMKKMLKDKKGNVTQADIDLAEKGYKNSQQYRSYLTGKKKSKKVK